MKDVKLLRVTNEEIEVLQLELFLFSEAQKQQVALLTINEFLEALISTDIALRLWYLFRRKVEGSQQKFSVRLKVSEACIVLKCCMWPRTGRSDYEKNIVEKYKTVIDQQLKSI
ncbi:hypothetical protein V1389_14595 [Flavobacterium rakeshii]|uniref:hypothetical protein n=1 Tax=Flavobacterium rakeshii TaxID=1038845 RepID=UPI002E7AC49A|nr:hypothetical protein [Flavobacterium rakeshii]MEE1899575.1 hypothetical protein [Flavobacterium rakeshii]